MLDTTADHGMGMVQGHLAGCQCFSPATLVVDMGLVPPLAKTGTCFTRTIRTVGKYPGITGRRRIQQLLEDLAVVNR